MEYIIDKEKVLLTVLFNRSILKHLKCKCDDYLILLQSIHKSKLFTLAKADTGYRIRRVPKNRRMYQINVSHRFSHINEFPLVDCSYFLKKNRTIKIMLK